MKRIYTLVLFSVLFNFNTSAQSTADNCKSIEDIIKLTLSALENNDSSAYASMLNKDTALSVFQIPNEEFYYDVSETVNVLSNNPEKWIKRHIDSFWILAYKIQKKFPNQELKIQYRKYLTISQKTIRPGFTNFYFNIFVNINGIDCELYEYAMKIHNCYYLITPLTDTFITFQQTKLDSLNHSVNSRLLDEKKK